MSKAFSTPDMAELDSKPVLISSGAKAHYGYDPSTGNELWRVEERTCHSAAARPVVGQGMIFIPAGFSKGTLLAIHPPKGGAREHCVVDASKPTGFKQAEDSPSELQVVWKSTRNVPNKPSLLLVGDLLFMVDDAGIAGCVEAKTGG